MGCCYSCCCKPGSSSSYGEKQPLLQHSTQTGTGGHTPHVRSRPLGYNTKSTDDARWNDNNWSHKSKLKQTESFRHRSLKRSYILLEIVSTEISYQNDLHTILDHVLIPLRESDIIRKDQLENIFAGWEVITSVSDRLCSQLKYNISQKMSINVENVEAVETMRRNTGSSMLDGANSLDNEDEARFERALKAFCTMSAFLKAIGAFSASYDQAIATLTVAEKSSPELRDFLRIFQREKTDVSHGLGIRSFLVKPIQRITKYPLFFRQLLKYTKETHPLYSKLIQAKEKVEKLVNEVDARVARQHELQKSIALISTLGGQQKRLGFLLAPGRHVLFHIRCQVKTHKASHALLRLQNRKFKDGLLIVLTDVLLLARPQILGRLRIARDVEKHGIPGVEGSWRLKSFLELEGLRISEKKPNLIEQEHEVERHLREEVEDECPSRPEELPSMLSSKNKQHQRYPSGPDLPPRPKFASVDTVSTAKALVAASVVSYGSPPPIPPKDQAYEVRRQSVAQRRNTRSRKSRSLAAPPIPPKKSSTSHSSEEKNHAQSLRKDFGTLYLSNIFKEGEAFGQVHSIEPDVIYEVSMPCDKLSRFRRQLREARFVCELSRQDLEIRQQHDPGAPNDVEVKEKQLSSKAKKNQ